MPPKQYIAWPASNDLKLRCAADGEPPLKYQWLKDGKIVTYRRLDPKFNGTKWYLRIKTAVPSDNGVYKCIVSNRLGNISCEIRLAVIEKGPIRPVLSSRFPVNKTARVGDNVTFQCIELFGPMLTDYRWLHWKKLPPSYPELKFDGIPTANSSYYTLINHRHYKAFEVDKKDGKYGGKVYLNNVTKEDEGMYTCVISNHVGQGIRSAFLRVNGTEIHAGKIEFAPDSYVADIGGTVRLKCAFTDWRVKWVMTWYKRGQILQLTTNGRIRSLVGKSSFLVIRHAQKDDAGIYECVASNEFGTVKRKLELTVRG
ncbi:fibroblast growth factor receptor 3-like [Dendronephthya gigantea]|uniref:fibroblast growth factor receptor 3-like n=1 Tax=Dendronephthya gigantea TaxID=151771 RepID=UPI00106B13D8|nr:fibroblast growth factor receptor 3-like [Dendronephthya gigantea]